MEEAKAQEEANLAGLKQQRQEIVDAFGGGWHTQEEVELQQATLARYDEKIEQSQKTIEGYSLTIADLGQIFLETGSKAEEAAEAEEPANEEVKAAPSVSASMKKDELLAVAKEMGVEVDAKATKADIIAAIEAK